MFTLLSNPGAKVFYLAIFFNAFIDLGHKITIQNTIFKVHDGSHQIILTAIVNGLILLPYIFLVIPIGRVSNQTAKLVMMRVAAWVSLLLTLLITAFYALGWFWPAFFMTLLMAVQSAFYSPAKLSYLKIMFGETNLSESNGLAQSIVIAGILFGTLTFSLGFETLYGTLLESGSLLKASPTSVISEALTMTKEPLNKDQVTAAMMPLGLGLIFLSLLQVFCVYQIPKSKQDLELVSHDDQLRVRASNHLFLIRSKASYLVPILGLALFWSVGQGMLAAFPAFAKAHANISNAAVIQAILASTALGLVAGSYLAGKGSKEKINVKLVPIGVAGLSIGLWSLTWLRQPEMFALDYFLMGVSSGLFIVPLNAFIQQQARGTEIGGVIAGSNFVQNIAMLSMLILTIAFAMADIDSRYLLQMMAALTTLVGSAIALLFIRVGENPAN